MVEIELDGRKVSVPEGSMVMHAADAAGTYIPHFCYHKKLSIAANCRMCLVDVEKAPKPMPACATPVTQGMIVRTKSDKALKAQQSVMEFLLINHPLDCPICDQGGECQLQDLAVGYGASSSRYAEDKRVVLHKDVGPLISMEEMTRCIHCTRCVRFGQEVAGVMELGMIHRGEHSEITTIAGETIDSELSGNMIDVCPVGALTSKPFRYSARTWELSRRKSVSPHDSTGANLVVQVKNHQVMRVVPLENEAVNECWLADRDRFSYEALNTDDRLTQPMIKQGGEWRTVDWTTALDYVCSSLGRVKSEHGAGSIAMLAQATSTNEELHLLARLARGLGTGRLEHRLRHADVGNRSTLADGTEGARWLGMPIAELSQLQRVFVVGSFLRKDHPLFAQRLRQAARRGARVASLHAAHDDWLLPMAESWSLAPEQWVEALSQIAAAVAQRTGALLPPELPAARAAAPSEAAQAVASLLLGGERRAVLVGNSALQHPQAATLFALCAFIAQTCSARHGVLGEAGNAVGAQVLGVLPAPDLPSPLLDGQARAVVLLNVEPSCDFADTPRALRALAAADTVIALSAFRSAVEREADVMLPITPFTETAGSFINAEGRLQTFHGVVRARGEARPGWKVLRVLGSMLGLPGFDFNSADEVLRDALPAGQASVDPRLDNRAGTVASRASAPVEVVAPAAGSVIASRVADVPIYATDAIVRRAGSLQLTADARPPVAALGPVLWNELGLSAGDAVELTGPAGSALLPARLDDALAPGTVRVAAAHPSTAALGPMFGSLRIARVSAGRTTEAA